MYQDLYPRFGFSADCPWPTNSKFYDFCKLYTTGSMLGAELLNLKEVGSDNLLLIYRPILLLIGVEGFIMPRDKKHPAFVTLMIAFWLL